MWGDGTYTFGLQIGDLEELYEHPRIGVGPIALFRRIQKDEWGPNDIPEVLRLGLIRGGNVAPVKALKLVERYYHQADKTEGKEVALKILGAYLLWPEDDPVGKTLAGEKNGHAATPVNSSPSPNSTPQAGN